MAYTDAQGRPELIMHPDIKRGLAAPRVVSRPDPVPSDEAQRTAGSDPVPATDRE